MLNVRRSGCLRKRMGLAVAIMRVCSFALVALAVAAASPLRAQEHSPRSDAPPPDAPIDLGSSVIARAGVAAGLLVIPVLGPRAGIAARFPLAERVAVEPHIDVVGGIAPMVGVLLVELGVPLVVESSTKRTWKPHGGIGPLLVFGTPFGHVEQPVLIALAGAEVVAGVTYPFGDGVEGRAQFSGNFAMGLPVPAFVLGGSFALGLMLEL